jgi:hypothetical protein
MKSIDTAASTAVARSRDSALADRYGKIGINAVVAAMHHYGTNTLPAASPAGKASLSAADRALFGEPATTKLSDRSRNDSEGRY